MPKWRDLGKSAKKVVNNIVTETKKALEKLDKETQDLQHDAKDFGDKLGGILKDVGRNIAEETKGPREKAKSHFEDAAKEWSKASGILVHKLKEGYDCMKHDDEYSEIVKLKHNSCKYEDIDKLLGIKAKLQPHNEYEVDLHNKIAMKALLPEVHCAPEHNMYFQEQTKHYEDILVNKCGYAHDEL